MDLRENKFYKPLLGAVCLVLLLGVSQIQPMLLRDRQRYGLMREIDQKGMPPVLAFTTVALGGFRGLIANMLWLRATDLQDEDKYFEMVQLADWITKLEPHFVQVWNVQAWNMAYNISVKFKDAPDRWRWVRAAIVLLRDEGLQFNPDEPLIYRELAWFFQHKMGANMDDAHMYYKNAWYQEMSQIFKGRPNFDELLHPQTDDAKARVKLLRETYKMDPAVMKAVDEKYGPLEWRLPETHAIYWGWLGLRKLEKDNAKQGQMMPLRRVIYQSMQLAFQRGTIVEDKFAGKFTLGPNLDNIANANQSYEDMMAVDADNRDNIENAHKNFLLNVPYFLYLYNRHPEANYWYKYLKQKYPTAIDDYMKFKHLAVTGSVALDEFAVIRTIEDAGETNHDKVTALLHGLFINAFLDLVQNEEDRSRNYQNLAQRVWQHYMNEVNRGTGEAGKIRVGLEPLAKIKQDVLATLLDPEHGLKPQLAAELRTRLGLPAPPPAGQTNMPPASATNAPPAEVKPNK